MNESHLSRILRTNSHAKFSPNEGVIDQTCNILKVLSIVLTKRKKTGQIKNAVIMDTVGFLPCICYPFPSTLLRHSPYPEQLLASGELIPFLAPVLGLISVKEILPTYCWWVELGSDPDEANKTKGGNLESFTKHFFSVPWWNGLSSFRPVCLNQCILCSPLCCKYLVVSGDIFDYHSSGLRCYWHLAGVGQECCWTSFKAQDSSTMTKNYLALKPVMPRLRNPNAVVRECKKTLR